MAKDEKTPKSLLNPLTLSGYISLTDEFSTEFITPIIKTIKLLNLLPKKDQPKRILIDINSPGGDVWTLTHLIETMWKSKIPVDTHTAGIAASCGCLLLMAGRNRTATQYSDIMSHQYSWGVDGKEHEIYGRFSAFKSGSRKMMDLYMKCTGKSEKYIKKHLITPTDVWLNASQAKKHGIIDKVIYM